MQFKALLLFVGAGLAGYFLLGVTRILRTAASPAVAAILDFVGAAGVGAVYLAATHFGFDGRVTYYTAATYAATEGLSELLLRPVLLRIAAAYKRLVDAHTKDKTRRIQDARSNRTEQYRKKRDAQKASSATQTRQFNQILFGFRRKETPRAEGARQGNDPKRCAAQSGKTRLFGTSRLRNRRVKPRPLPRSVPQRADGH
ncbi:MAG TPA: hypothetical protein IAB14_06240 [Candidatus Stercoripulliclostridium merdipullorum]|uniref:Uncharacterized protein n=1 Tax=Candidatus Stercoripulliclostridium merdipullorum TaxID=2840952 RepID=A0A9D1NCQ1_9FIRM|nr:hypothetical protein [Candidatus Stercoripulliclostridium merdipullorum]